MFKRNKISLGIGGWLKKPSVMAVAAMLLVQAGGLFAQGVAIPVAPAAPSEDAVAYLRVREPNKLLDRLGQWASLVSPQMNRDMMAMMLQGNLGVDLNELQSGGNVIAAFYFNPEVMDMDFAAMLPVTADGAAAQSFRQQLGPANVGSGADRLILAKTPEMVAKAQGLADSLKSVAQNQLGSDIDLVINVAGVMKNYGAMLKTQATSMLGFMSMMTMNQPGLAGQDPAQMQAQLQNQVNALFNFLDQTQTMAIQLDFDPQNLLLSTVVEAKAGTDMASGLSRNAAPGRNLSQYLDNGMIRTQLSMDAKSDFWKRYMDFSVKSMGITDAALAEKVKEELASWMEMGATNMALSFGVKPDQSLQYQALMEIENPDKFDEFFNSKIKTFSEGSMHEAYKQMGMDLNMTVEENVRQVQGLNITRLKTGVKLLENYPAPPEMAAGLQKIMTQDNIEIARDGKLVYIALGGAIDNLISRVKSNTAAGDLESRMSNPAGGMFYADMDVNGYLKLIESMMPAGQAPAMPDLGDLPPVKMSGYHQGGKAYYRLQLPKSLIQQASQKLMGAQQPPM